MPVISRFFGITIKMYIRQKEHNPPHIHAIYGDYIGMFSIESGEMFEGDIPMKEQRIIRRFISNYKNKLLEMWENQQFELLPYNEQKEGRMYGAQDRRYKGATKFCN